MRTRSRTTAHALLTVGEAAERLTVSTRAIWALLAGGRLRRVKLGKRATRVDAAEIDRLIGDALAKAKG